MNRTQFNFVLQQVYDDSGAGTMWHRWAHTPLILELPGHEAQDKTKTGVNRFTRSQNKESEYLL